MTLREANLKKSRKSARQKFFYTNSKFFWQGRFWRLVVTTNVSADTTDPSPPGRIQWRDRPQNWPGSPSWVGWAMARSVARYLRGISRYGHSRDPHPHRGGRSGCQILPKVKIGGHVQTATKRQPLVKTRQESNWGHFKRCLTRF